MYAWILIQNVCHSIGWNNILFSSSFGNIKLTTVEMPGSRTNSIDERRWENRIVASTNAWDIGCDSRIGDISIGHWCDWICGQIAENHYTVDDCADRFAGWINIVCTCRWNGIETLGHCRWVSDALPWIYRRTCNICHMNTKKKLSIDFLRF